MTASRRATRVQVHFVRYYRDDLYGGLYSTAVVPWQMHAMAVRLAARGVGTV